MELLTGGARFPVEREMGLTLFERHLALLQEGRVEAAQVPTRAPEQAVLHLILGVPGIVLLDLAPRSDEAGSVIAPARDEVPDRVHEDQPLHELFPDFDTAPPLSDQARQ